MYPILEFDDDPNAIIVPHAHHLKERRTDRCVVCFFHDVVSRVAQEKSATVVTVIPTVAGPFPIYEADFDGRMTAFYVGGVGAPLAASLLEKAIAHGYVGFVACGSCGVLESAIPSGHVVVPTSAVRDEGTSYHYAHPSTEIAAQPGAVKAITDYLEELGIPFDTAKTWTTDGFFRETKKRISKRKSQGCKIVEMEASALFAVAQFRGVRFGQILYAGDDVAGDTWDRREWNLADGDVRTKVFELAVEACHLL